MSERDNGKPNTVVGFILVGFLDLLVILIIKVINQCIYFIQS